MPAACILALSSQCRSPPGPANSACPVSMMHATKLGYRQENARPTHGHGPGLSGANKRREELLLRFALNADETRRSGYCALYTLGRAMGSRGPDSLSIVAVALVGPPFLLVSGPEQGGYAHIVRLDRTGPPPPRRGPSMRAMDISNKLIDLRRSRLGAMPVPSFSTLTPFILLALFPFALACLFSNQQYRACKP